MRLSPLPRSLCVVFPFYPRRGSPALQASGMSVFRVEYVGDLSESQRNASSRPPILADA